MECVKGYAMNILEKRKVFYFVIDMKKKRLSYFFLLTKKKIPVGISTGRESFRGKICVGVGKVMHSLGDKGKNLTSSIHSPDVCQTVRAKQRVSFPRMRDFFLTLRETEARPL